MQTLRTLARWVDEQTQTLADAAEMVTEGLRYLGTGGLGAPNRIMARMREAGAVSPQTAQRVHLASPAEEAAFESLREMGWVRQRSLGRFWLDERAVERARMSWPH